MPEGHTVHRLARALGELFTGETLAVSSPQGRFAAGAALLDGHVLVASEAWGKQLFLGFADPARARAVLDDPSAVARRDDVRWLRVHLGLYGAWTFAGDGSTAVVHAIGAPRRRVGERETVPAEPVEESPDDAWSPPAPRGAVRARLLGRHAVADLNGPTACEVITGAEKGEVERRLGPDPIRDPRPGEPDPREEFVTAVRRSRSAVALLLMNQDVVAGVGNIYRAESLFRAGLDPLRPGRDVPTEVLGGLWDDLVVLMHDGVRRGAIVTTRPEDRDAPGPAPVTETAPGAGRRVVRQNTDGDPGAVPRDESFYVYRRDGLPCRVCGTPVLLKELAGRNLFWCGVCQT
ncbi:Fpg/Nei family DNA glycosylase [Cellulosimicrobium protaetiae]|uniref:DNA-(apurinic or apyrimidinic site) lyase n=1 Tax=Cellulosimicrobium protaetiae TaxID=2587808 RepID=A0A6M5UIW5_9MICO|nr:zinc finger domain-containing protein [Cellulosimicrobium protaetiae]QJW37173.1 Fpg/Nei family DNA glycosylase [Cellulosimicrobium protaetiae]